MTEEVLAEGDWIVHQQHGVGQITAIEKKTIGNEEHQYFRVRTNSGVYWLPVKSIPDYVRAVSSQTKFRKVLALISQAPQPLLKNYKERNRQISERLENATLETKGELIRDLYARRYAEGLNLSALNERQLSDLRQQFLCEMVVVLDVEMREAEEMLEKALKKSVLLISGSLNQDETTPMAH
jgi:RNA polymerase-interacting CarD/CdnL/TRCF family regulator